MAEVFVRNPLNQSQLITISVSMRQIIYKTPDPEYSGEPIWVLEGVTLAKDCEGNLLSPEYTHLRSHLTFDEEVNSLVNRLASKICWESLTDFTPPYITSISPFNLQEDVPVTTTISINLKDGFEKEVASAGINKNAIKLFVKGYDVSSLISVDGNPWNYNVSFTPGTLEHG